jgi:hypothetical protein
MCRETTSHNSKSHVITLWGSAKLVRTSNRKFRGYRSLEQQNLKGAFKAHLYQVKRERHAQIEKDQSAAAFPQDSWTITTNFMQDLF